MEYIKWQLHAIRHFVISYQLIQKAISLRTFLIFLNLHMKSQSTLPLHQRPCRSNCVVICLSKTPRMLFLYALESFDSSDCSWPVGYQMRLAAQCLDTPDRGRDRNGFVSSFLYQKCIVAEFLLFTQCTPHSSHARSGVLVWEFHS